MTGPFDDFQSLLLSLPEPDAAAERHAAIALGDSYGRLGALATWLAGWQGSAAPRIVRPILALYAATHEGEGAPADAARRRLEGFAAGEGALSAAARVYGAGVEAFDLAIDRPTPDAALRAPMSERECAATLAFGMESVAKHPDLLIVGEITDGADRAAAAVVAALFGGDWGAPNDADWAACAAARAQGEGATEPLQILRQLGGRETAAMAGAILAARVQKVPVVLDGYAAAAAGAVLQALAPDALDHCRAAQLVAHPGHGRLLDRLGLAPMLDLGLSRSEGLGGLAALGLARTACALLGG